MRRHTWCRSREFDVSIWPIDRSKEVSTYAVYGDHGIPELIRCRSRAICGEALDCRWSTLSIGLDPTAISVLGQVKRVRNRFGELETIMALVDCVPNGNYIAPGIGTVHHIPALRRRQVSNVGHGYV